MTFYAERVFLPLMNRLMDTAETRRIRERVCAPLAGDVVEIGFGSGLNVPHLPSAVTSLRAVDPLQRGRALAARRLAASHVSVEVVGLDGRSLPLADGSADGVLATWTLCSIPDPVTAVQEIVRVLRPGGRLHFVEHGRSPDPGVARWQERLDGFQRRTACGCSLTKDIPAILEAGGLTVEELDTYYAKGDPKTHGWTFEGVARAAAVTGGGAGVADGDVRAPTG